MGVLSELFSPHSILSGGITFINDRALNATGQGTDTTLGAVNNGLKNGPLESSFNQGSPRKKTEPYGTNNYSTYNANSYAGADGNTIGVVGGIAYLFGPDGTVISSMPADHPELQSTLHSAVNTQD